jgi:hypothetical protein
MDSKRASIADSKRGSIYDSKRVSIAESKRASLTLSNMSIHRRDSMESSFDAARSPLSGIRALDEVKLFAIL